MQGQQLVGASRSFVRPRLLKPFAENKQRGERVLTLHRKAKPIKAKRNKTLDPPAAGEKLTIRLLKPLNDIVRRAALYRGDISKTISEALESVDLVEVRALDLEED